MKNCFGKLLAVMGVGFVCPVLKREVKTKQTNKVVQCIEGNVVEINSRIKPPESK